MDPLHRDHPALADCYRAAVQGVEVPFSLELCDPKTGECPPPLIGSIDAIVKENSTTSVWELKAGKRRWSQDQLDFDIQATVHLMATRHLGHAGAELRLLVTTKTKVPKVQNERLGRSHRDQADFMDVAVGVSRAMEAGIEYPLRGWQCRSCAYMGSCS